MAGEPDGSTEPTTVPIDAIPDPVFGYACPTDEPTLAVTNAAFEATSDGLSEGDAVQAWLRETCGADPATADAVCASLADGDPVDERIDGGAAQTSSFGECRIRTLEPVDTADEVDGYVLVRDADAGGSDGLDEGPVTELITHDLRNPLDVATAHLRAARRTGDAEHFDQVEGAHDRMERIIRDVLALARGGDALAVDADVDVAAVATDAWETVDTADATLSVAGDLPRIDADPDRLRRLFENLFRNSVEHGRPDGEAGSGVNRGAARDADDADGDPSVQVRVGALDAGFFVADDGVGIPEDVADRAFDAGVSAVGGTGLGLAIVDRIAEAHGWTATVTSAADGGARFEFRQPAGGDRTP